jgi:hypothetical protein
MITYFALDLESKRFYVGSTTSIENRIKGHKKGKDYPFQNALVKRPETFFWVWGEDNLDSREEEQFYLDFYFGSRWCYNLNPMASVPPSWKGRTRTEENRKKVADSKKGKPRPDLSARNRSEDAPRRKTEPRPEEVARFVEMARRPKTEEHKIKLSKLRSSLRGYNDGKEYRYFVPGEEPDGWTPGKPGGMKRVARRNEKGQFKGNAE